MISPLYFLAIVALVGLSAFFSASEMAYSSANALRLENARDSGSRRAAVACVILNKFDDALSAILIGNNLVNISTSSIASVIALTLAAETGGNSGLYNAVATVAVTIIVIIFGETVPKVMAKKNTNRLAMSFAYPVRLLMLLLKPVIMVVVWLVRLVTKPMKGGEPQTGQDAAVEELFSIIETVEDEGIIDEERSELLQAALDFSEVSASEVMTARVDMLAIDIDDDWDEILRVIDQAPYSRLPVYEDSIDNIIGFLYLNHFFKAMIDSERVDIRRLLMKPCYVYKTMKLPAVLEELRLRQTHMAIVTDEYGGAMGVITMEDVLEQLVGEIWDETDVVEDDVIEKENGLYELDGDLSIGEFLELIERGEDDFDTDSATVGGWTIEKFGGFPKNGDSFTFENLTVTVIAADAQRVEKVLVKVDKIK